MVHNLTPGENGERSVQGIQHETFADMVPVEQQQRQIDEQVPDRRAQKAGAVLDEQPEPERSSGQEAVVRSHGLHPVGDERRPGRQQPQIPQRMHAQLAVGRQGERKTGNAGHGHNDNPNSLFSLVRGRGNLFRRPLAQPPVMTGRKRNCPALSSRETSISRTDDKPRVAAFTPTTEVELPG